MKNQFLSAKEVAEVCSCSLSRAYKTCRELNAELESKGFLTFSGKVPRRYLMERIYGVIEEGAE